MCSYKTWSGLCMSLRFVIVGNQKGAANIPSKCCFVKGLAHQKSSLLLTKNTTKPLDLKSTWAEIRFGGQCLCDIGNSLEQVQANVCCQNQKTGNSETCRIPAAGFLQTEEMCSFCSLLHHAELFRRVFPFWLTTPVSPCVTERHDLYFPLCKIYLFTLYISFRADGKDQTFETPLQNNEFFRFPCLNMAGSCSGDHADTSAWFISEKKTVYRTFFFPASWTTVSNESIVHKMISSQPAGFKNSKKQ